MPSWISALNQMLKAKPEKLVPSHTLSITNKAEVMDRLAHYRDAEQYVFNKTIEGMNKGMAPDE